MNRAARFAVRSKLITVAGRLAGLALDLSCQCSGARHTRAKRCLSGIRRKLQFRLPLCGIIGLYRRQHLWRLRLEFLRGLELHS